MEHKSLGELHAREATPRRRHATGACYELDFRSDRSAGTGGVPEVADVPELEGGREDGAAAQAGHGRARARFARRFVAFYLVVAVVTAAVVVLVVDKGRHEHALPSIAGGYDASAPNPCLGKAPAPPPGIPLPPTAPTQPRQAGPSFNVLQSGQFVNINNNQGTLSGQLRLHSAADKGGHHLTGTVSCRSGGSRKLDAVAIAGAKGSISGSLGGVPFSAAFKRDPPAPGSPAPRTPSGIGGTYALSPSSTCFGGTMTVSGGGSRYGVSAKGDRLGQLSYSSTTGAVFGDIACAKGGHARLTATANDLQLQNVQVIPLDVAAPSPASLPGKPVLVTPSGLAPAGEKFTATKQRSEFGKLVAAFFLAVAVVLIIARLFGIVAERVGQPRVMGEVIAGIALGPSVLGAISANLQASVYPTDILPAFGIAANLGLVFYMFLIGMEVDRDQLKGKAAQAALISNASVALPMLLGLAAALPLYKLVGPNKKFVAFALFMGVSMSITAFPVLARILAERRMIKGAIGSLAIACAAIDDVTAWFLIALATTIAISGTFGDVAATVGEATAFVLVMWFVVRRVLERMATAFDELGRIPPAWFAAVVVGVLLSAYLTEEINIAVIFGAFIMGMVMPRHARLTEEVTRRIEDFVVTLLLPMFFVYTGLRTNVGLLDRPALWLITAGLVLIAIVGKLAGALIAARVGGMDWRASAVIGTLMNTRGLTELIVLNLALDAGAISNALFAALVLMAIITTLMAGPLLKVLDPQNKYGRDVHDDFADAALQAVGEYPELPVPERSILVAPQTDEALEQLVALAEPLARSAPPRELIIARLVAPPRAAGAGVRGGLQTENLRLEEASHAINELRRRLADSGVVARGVALTSSKPGTDLVHIVEREPVDLVLTEGRRRLIGEGLPFGDVGTVLEKAPCDVAVLIARAGVAIAIDADHPVVVPFGGAEHDWAALELGSWLAASTGAELKLLGTAGQSNEEASVTRLLADAGLLVQQATGVETEPLVVAGGRGGIIAAAQGAGLLVLGLSDRWRREGLGPVRSEIARAAPAPVLFVRRGVRPGVFAPRDNATQFKWSSAGSAPSTFGRSIFPRPSSAARLKVPLVEADADE
jgi:Kef-type K+ transport system membrane component KefB/nucleotide-binding universal stress UspA family protein